MSLHKTCDGYIRRTVQRNVGLRCGESRDWMDRSIVDVHRMRLLDVIRLLTRRFVSAWLYSYVSDGGVCSIDHLGILIYSMVPSSVCPFHKIRTIISIHIIPTQSQHIPNIQNPSPSLPTLLIITNQILTFLQNVPILIANLLNMCIANTLTTR